MQDVGMIFPILPIYSRLLCVANSALTPNPDLAAGPCHSRPPISVAKSDPSTDMICETPFSVA